MMNVQSPKALPHPQRAPIGILNHQQHHTSGYRYYHLSLLVLPPTQRPAPAFWLCSVIEMLSVL
jgi:hypothetical protein